MSSAGRKRIDSFIRNEMAHAGFRNPVPEQGLIFDYLYSVEQHKRVSSTGAALHAACAVLLSVVHSMLSALCPYPGGMSERALLL